MRIKTALGLGLLVVFGALVVNSFGAQVAAYETFGEADANGRRAHVVGTWLRERPTVYDPATNRFSFFMADQDGVVRQVVYADPKPANFEDATQVVVDGRADGEAFAAEHILVKCPSKYNEARGLDGPAQPASLPAGG